MSDTPKMNASLFHGHKHSDKIDYSGTVSVSRDDLKLLAAYANSEHAVADDYGIKLYVNGWKKESASGKKYISMSIEPPKQAYEDSMNGAASAPASVNDDDMPF